MNAAQLRRVRWIYPRLASIAGHEIRPYTDLREAFPEIRYYTFLRDPKRRAISAFSTKIGHQIAERGTGHFSEAEIEKSLHDFLIAQRHKMCRDFAPCGNLQEAIEALDKDVGFIGIVEQFDLSLNLLRDWFGMPGLDMRYVMLNRTAERANSVVKLRPFGKAIASADEAIETIMTCPTIAALLEEVTERDRALYDHAVTKRFFPQMRKFEAGGGRSEISFSVAAAPREAAFAKAHRDILGRNLVPLLTRSVQTQRM